LLPPSSTLFPYTTLFRSRRRCVAAHAGRGIRPHPRPLLALRRRGAGLAGALVGAGAPDVPHARPTEEPGSAERGRAGAGAPPPRSEEHTSELQSLAYLVC